MDFTSVKQYLDGKAFSNSLKVKISKPENKVAYRLDTIRDMVKNKNVIHFGCADHLEVIEFKIKKNIWLHNVILNSAKSCTGIDNNKEAVYYLKDKLNIPNVFCIEIENEELPGEISNRRYDLVVMGEILEHIDNPVHFMTTVRNKFKGIADEIILTGPNALRWNNFRFALKQTELINSDHRYWFTPYTLGKIMNRAGFENINFEFVENSKPEKFSPRKHFLYRYYPSFRDTVLVQARI